MDDATRVIRDMEIRRASTETDYEVVMANDMVRGTSNLSLNELKLLRTIIMQIKPGDTKLYPYRISVKDFQKMTGLKGDKIYGEADKMTDHIMREIIKIGDGNPKHKWEKFQWVSMCKYSDGVFTIQLNQALEPYLINLRRFYTKFKLEEIVKLKTTYSIRLLELLYEGMRNAPIYGEKSTEVYLPMDVIRKATNTVDKYTSVYLFKERVVTSAVNEINQKSGYYITVDDVKKSRKVDGYKFTIETKVWHELKERDPEAAMKLLEKAEAKEREKNES